MVGNGSANAKHVTLKSAAEIQIMRKANQIVAATLDMLRRKIYPGCSTKDLDLWAEQFAKKNNAVPAFKGYHGFPGSLCVSLNEQVVHGIPSKDVILKKGDIISIDFGVKYRGYFGDAAITVAIGNVSKEKSALLESTNQALYKGIEMAKVGKRVNDISSAIQKHVEEQGYSVVRQFVGHGIGSNLHEGPEIPNFVRNNKSPRLLPGMVIAIEPMVNLGSHDVKVLQDGWTVVTVDKSPSAHFEHSIAVTEDGPIILSELSCR